ncbi:MAG TPA: SHOCT domain-containing protein [Candidatus Limnocylindrales bacterium]|nr:SHOCT domain-containing protein [Candidatus Limnocylindrales bacterium]
MVPVTPEGRIAAAVLMLLGIGLFSTITATITGYVLESRRDRQTHTDTSVVGELERLAQLRSDGALTEEEFARAKRSVIG